MVKKMALATIVIVAFGLLPACVGPMPTPIPTPTPSFEQKRTDVLRYIKAFNSIENSFNDTYSRLQLPGATSGIGPLAANSAFNQFYTQVATANDGALSRLGELLPSSLDSDTAVHLEKAKSVYRQASVNATNIKEAYASGDQTRFLKVIEQAQALNSEASAVNRATEQLLLKYNISDPEVSYRFRGK